MNSKRAILGLFVIALAAGTGAGASEAGKAAPAAPGITASLPARYTTSGPLRDVAPLREAGKKVRVMPAHRIPRERLSREAPPAPQPDAALQTAAPRAGMPSPVRNFEGVSNVNGVLPPDTDGDVGPDHYLQIVNLSFQIFDKATGASVYGPAANNTLWASLGGICASNNDGDPIVMYDSYAGRWVFSQFALDFPDNFHECVAVSASSDPTGSWYLYDFQISTAKMNDYPKLGVWPDGYYMSVNQFDGVSSAWAGVGAVAFERDQMLVGGPAQMIYMDLFPTYPDLAGMLPADADGLLPPPAGTPNFFVQVDNDSWGFPQDRLEVWEFHVDWSTPANSTFTQSSTSPLAVSAWTELCSGTRSCIPQPGTTQGLDAIGDRLMYRLQYRNFGTHESMVVNHTVDAGGGDAGVRWYELRDAGAGWSLHQQGTYAGDGGPDGESRWMGSLAMDRQGNMALGYSVSSASTYPSIRYVGRLAGDPLDTLPQGETSLVAGNGSQAHVSARWGDYSSMTVDPDDDCTFWYTQEYYAATSSANWQTRVGSFKFPGCTSGPSGTLNGTVTAAAGGAPIEGARMDIGPYTTYTGPAGTYEILLPVGTYDVTASRWGYAPGAAPAVDVLEGVTTTQDFSLAQAPGHTVHGTVTDAATGWPLYAEVDYTHGSAWTDPLTGGYSVVLPEGSYTLQVTDFAGAYEPASSPVTVDADRQVDFALSADASCTAAGYAAVTALGQDFGACALPAGWTVVNNGGGCTWAFDDPGGRGNLTGGAGCFAIADSDLCGSGTRMDTDLVSPSVNLSSLAEVTLGFRYDVYDFSGGTVCEVDVSTDGGSAWTNVWSQNGASDRGPATARVDITAVAANEADVKVRFHYEGDYQWWWEVDDVAVSGPCTAPAGGGLVLGNVRDGNTGTALDGATVEAGPGHEATTVATPQDDSLDDGFYTLFVPTAGAAALSAGAPGGYGPQGHTVAVPLLGTVWQDFSLPAGSLGAVPDSVEVSLLPGGARSVLVSLDNAGLIEAEFELAEINAPVPARPHGPFAPATRHMSPKGLSDLDTSTARYVFPRPASPVIQAAGDVVQSWPSGLALPWGTGYDNSAGEVWLGNPAVAGGDDLDRGFLPGGAATGETVDTAGFVADWAADFAYDWLNGTLWQVNVGGDDCVYELDLQTLAPTGDSICPAFGTSERGLAYNPLTDTFYAGSWNDDAVKEFDRSGTILRSASTGLPISGLAFNPVTQHLFAMVNTDSMAEVQVLDVNDGFSNIGQFGIIGFSDFGGAGLAMDCGGRLWAADQVTQVVHQVESGESGTCTLDIPWLAVTPVSGTVPAAASRPVALDFDTTGLPPGTYEAHLQVGNDTPYGVFNLPVTLHVMAPAVTASASSVGSGSAQLNGEVNSAGAEAEYYFEYGATAGYGQETAHRFSSAPGPIAVSEPIAGLDPGTVYHFRLVVVVGGQTYHGEDVLLATGTGAVPLAPLYLLLLGS